jgi:hypothetical protein
MSKVYGIKAIRYVYVEIAADSSDDAWEQAEHLPLDDWDDEDFEMMDIECVSGSAKEHFGPDRHGE